MRDRARLVTAAFFLALAPSAFAAIDLTSAVVSISPTTSSPGSLLTITYRVNNIGTTSTGIGSGLKLYLSSDATLDGADTYLSPSVSIATLGAGMAVTGTVSRTLPSSLSCGTWYIISQADGFNAITESNETNNTGSAALTVSGCSAPDLVVAIESVTPNNLCPGESLSIQYRVTNQGPVSADANGLKLYLSSDSSLDAGDVYLPPSVSIAGLCAGCSVTGTVPRVIPADTAPGIRYLIGQVDGFSAVAEADETNNTGYNVFQVDNCSGSLPDLEATSISISPSGGITETTTVTITGAITNLGGGITTPFNWILSVDGNTLDSGRPANLAAGGTLTAASISWTGTLTSGVHNIQLVADSSSEISESNESNNARSLTVSVAGASAPDLVVAIDAVNPNKLCPGELLTIQYRVTNRGSVSAGANGLRLWMSSNSTLDGGDLYLLPSVSIASLCANCSVSGTVTRAVPPDTAPGIKYLIGEVDAFDGVAESDETNNTEFNVFQVDDCSGSPPDLEATSITISPSSGVTDTTPVTITGVITNKGGAVTVPFDWTLSVDGNRVDSGRAANLAAGGSLTAASISWTGLLAAGAHEIRLVADSSGEIAESDESNNVGSRSLTVTSEAVLEPSFDPSAIQLERGRTASLTLSLGGSAPGAFEVEIASSLPGIIEVPSRLTVPAGQTHASLVVQGLETGGPVSVTATLPETLGGRSTTAQVTVVGTPPRVVVSALPDPMIQIVEDGQPSTTSLAVSNRGDTESSVTLAPAFTVGTPPFFTISPASFTLAGGASRIVTIDAAPQPLGSYTGHVDISGNGVVIDSRRVTVRLLATGRPGTEVANVIAVESRVDVSGKEDVNPRGAVRFRNEGDGSATGVVAVDVPWIIADQDGFTIAPGALAEVDFTVDRARRPDADELTGSVSGHISFVYPRLDQLGKSTVESVPSLATPTTTVVDTVTPEVSASGIPLLRPGEIGFVLGGVGSVTGSVGNFVSDLAIVNSLGSKPISDMKIYYLPEGATEASVVSQTASGGQSIALADAVATVFGGSQQLGTFHIRSASVMNLGIGANVFNKTPATGSYGTAIPSFRTDRGAADGERLRISGLRKSATNHTNLYFQELIGYPVTVDLTFFDGSGTIVGAETGLTVPPFGLVRLLQDRVPEGTMTLLVDVGGGGSVAAFATPVDRASGDTWAVTDWNRYYGVDGAQVSVIPVTGALAGANGTYFRTDISIAFGDETPSPTTLRYHQQSPEVKTFEKTVQLPANSALELEDAAVAFFGAAAPTVGWVEIVPSAGSHPSVTSRTYTTVTGTSRTFGTGVPVIPRDQALLIGQSRVIGGLKSATAETIANGTGNTFRTNVGLVEVSGGTLVVRVSVLFPDGRQLTAGGARAYKDYVLTARQWIQINSVVEAIMGTAAQTLPNLDNLQVRVDVLGGDGALIPYVTLTDNGSGDTVLRIE